MRGALTGSRIRERRQISGLRQAELARRVGISASYLNLIEHNRRRIGGKLLVDIAGVLSVEPSVLTQGIEATLISALREAAVDAIGQKAEVDGLEEFAGRFPGWAGVLAQMHRRVVSLERTVEALSDRLTHDPHLAASMHEVLSTAAAIRSTAAILADTQDLDSEWQDRFHKNLHQDAERLADSSKALVTYLDDSDSAVDPRGAPLEEVEAFFEAHAHHFPEIEETGDWESIPLDTFDTSAARTVAQDTLQSYAEDARAIPLEELKFALNGGEPNPALLATHFSVDIATVLRRLACLPEGTLARPAGLVICDASGNILFFKGHSRVFIAPPRRSVPILAFVHRIEQTVGSSSKACCAIGPCCCGIRLPCVCVAAFCPRLRFGAGLSLDHAGATCRGGSGRIRGCGAGGDQLPRLSLHRLRVKARAVDFERSFLTGSRRCA